MLCTYNTLQRPSRDAEMNSNLSAEHLKHILLSLSLCRFVRIIAQSVYEIIMKFSFGKRSRIENIGKKSDFRAGIKQSF